jgi:two-component system, cell cycle response regulator
MRFQATHDALTSLSNRRAMMEMLQRELARSVREQKPIAILLADLDHFKKVNDSYGQTAGDEVLKEIARRLQSSVRSYDLVGRHGGEEFLVVLPNCSEIAALSRADALRTAVAEPVQTSLGPVRVTLSIGVYVFADVCSEPLEALSIAVGQWLSMVIRQCHNLIG